MASHCVGGATDGQVGVAQRIGLMVGGGYSELRGFVFHLSVMVWRFLFRS